MLRLIVDRWADLELARLEREAEVLERVMERTESQADTVTDHGHFPRDVSHARVKIDVEHVSAAESARGVPPLETWSAFLDQETMTPYYHCSVTGETTWDPPTAYPELADAGNQLVVEAGGALNMNDRETAVRHQARSRPVVARQARGSSRKRKTQKDAVEVQAENQAKHAEEQAAAIGARVQTAVEAATALVAQLRAVLSDKLDAAEAARAAAQQGAAELHIEALATVQETEAAATTARSELDAALSAESTALEAAEAEAREAAAAAEILAFRLQAVQRGRMGRRKAAIRAQKRERKMRALGTANRAAKKDHVDAAQKAAKDVAMARRQDEQRRIAEAKAAKVRAVEQAAASKAEMEARVAAEAAAEKARQAEEARLKEQTRQEMDAAIRAALDKKRLLRDDLKDRYKVKSRKSAKQLAEQQAVAATTVQAAVRGRSSRATVVALKASSATQNNVTIDESDDFEDDFEDEPEGSEALNEIGGNSQHEEIVATLIQPGDDMPSNMMTAAEARAMEAAEAAMAAAELAHRARMTHDEDTARAATRMQAAGRGKADRAKVASLMRERNDQEAAATQMQAARRGKADRAKAAMRKETKVREDAAATQMQAVGRGRRDRAKASILKKNLHAQEIASKELSSAPILDKDPQSMASLTYTTSDGLDAPQPVQAASTAVIPETAGKVSDEAPFRLDPLKVEDDVADARAEHTALVKGQAAPEAMQMAEEVKTAGEGVTSDEAATVEDAVPAKERGVMEEMTAKSLSGSEEAMASNEAVVDGALVEGGAETTEATAAVKPQVTEEEMASEEAAAASDEVLAEEQVAAEKAEVNNDMAVADMPMAMVDDDPSVTEPVLGSASPSGAEIEGNSLPLAEESSLVVHAAVKAEMAASVAVDSPDMAAEKLVAAREAAAAKAAEEAAAKFAAEEAAAKVAEEAAAAQAASKEDEGLLSAEKSSLVVHAAELAEVTASEAVDSPDMAAAKLVAAREAAAAKAAEEAAAKFAAEEAAAKVAEEAAALKAAEEAATARQKAAEEAAAKMVADQAAAAKAAEEAAVAEAARAEAQAAAREEARKEAAQAAAAKTSAAKAAESERKKQRFQRAAMPMSALAKFESQEDTEMEMLEGEIVLAIEPATEEGWTKVRALTSDASLSKSGFVPAAYLGEAPHGTMLSSFTGVSEVEASQAVTGERVWRLDADKEGWAPVFLESHISGLVPASHVDWGQADLSSSAPSTLKDATPMLVIADFESQDPAELEVRMGDAVIPLEITTDDGWVKVQMLNSLASGYVPQGYLKDCTSGEMLADFAGEMEGEIPEVKTGDTLWMLTPDQDGWTLVYTGSGAYGMVPSAWVEWKGAG